MSTRRSGALSWLGIGGSVICLTAFAVWLILQFSGGDLDRGDKLASIVSMSITVVTLPLSVLALIVTLRQGRTASPAGTISTRLDAMADSLAISVRAQWEAEEQVRRIHDPFPLPARWSNAADHLRDHWQNINGSPEASEPITLDGHGDDIVAAFHRIPSGRLVVLGKAGAGKTILTSRFVLTLLADRESFPGTPVPVIFSLGSWDPTASSLPDWQAEQLISTYPVLAERDDTGRTAAAQLLTTGRILPVLDGFDEISRDLRTAAIDGINTGLRRGDRLLLTSRPEEYEAAVRAGDVVTAAAVVLLEGLTVTDLATYLPLTTRKTAPDGTGNKWDPVLEHLRLAPERTVLAEVLSTPLMVALARTIFSQTDHDPAELIGIASVSEVEDRLLTGFVPAVYGEADADHASHWLRFLARHLERLGTYDLAWWHLIFAVPRVVIGLVSGVVIAVMSWLALGMWGSFDTFTSQASSAWLTASVLSVAAAGVAAGIVVGTGRGIRSTPARMRLRIAGRRNPVRRDLHRGLRSRRTLLWFVVWCGGGTLFGLAAALIAGQDNAIAVGLVAGVGAGLAAWFVAVTVRALGSPVDPTDTVSPTALLRTDRTTALHQGLMAGAGIATVLWLTMRLAIEPGLGLPFADAFPDGRWIIGWLTTTACATAIWMLFVSVWGPWVIARTWLLLTGRLPWSVTAFLADAHRRGVLRQAGGVYQFRHARLQDHLAT